MLTLKTRALTGAATALLGLMVAASTLVTPAPVHADNRSLLPDPRVTYLGKSYVPQSVSEMKVVYRFQISNVGSVDAQNVAVSSFSSRKLVASSSSENIGEKSYGDFVETISLLKAGASVERTVTCHEIVLGPTIWHCAGASMTLKPLQDKDFTNNSAHGS